MQSSFDFGRPQQSLAEKLWSINWGLILLLSLLACVGFAMLYSAANGSWQPWAGKQAIRFGVALVIMLAVALVDLRNWLKWAYILYGIAFVLLIAVEVRGLVGMGAQRIVMGLDHRHDIGGMDLEDRDQSAARQHRLRCAAAVLGDVIGIVLRAKADIQPRNDAGRDAAAPAEKAVRDIAQGAGAQRLDIAHSLACISRSSSS